MKNKSDSISGKVSAAIWEYFPEYWGISTYPADQCVAFCKVSGEWGIFSNFARTPIVTDGQEYSCVEQMFQCLKFTDPDIIADIKSASGQTIKMKAKHWTRLGKQRPDWDAMFINILKHCLRLKYEQSADFRQALIDSGTKVIIEDQSTFPKKNADAYGCKLIGDKFVGPNLMGRLLMELRAEQVLEKKMSEFGQRLFDLTDAYLYEQDDALNGVFLINRTTLEIKIIPPYTEYSVPNGWNAYSIAKLLIECTDGEIEVHEEGVSDFVERFFENGAANDCITDNI